MNARVAARPDSEARRTSRSRSRPAWRGLLSFRNVAALFLLVSAPAMASDDPGSRSSLGGVRSVQVIVDEFDRELVAAGLSTSTIKTDVERRLRSLGIHVGAADAMELEPSYLVININGFLVETVRGQRRGLVTNVKVSFNQQVQLARSPAIQLFVPTWSSSMVSYNNTVEPIRKTTIELVDEFASAFVSANPTAEGRTGAAR